MLSCPKIGTRWSSLIFLGAFFEPTLMIGTIYVLELVENLDQPKIWYPLINVRNIVMLMNWIPFKVIKSVYIILYLSNT